RYASALRSRFQKIIPAASRRVDYVASRGQPVREPDTVAGPFRGFRERIVRADHLCAGMQQFIPPHGVVRSCGYGVLIRPRTDDVTLTNQLIDHLRAALVFSTKAASGFPGSEFVKRTLP